MDRLCKAQQPAEPLSLLLVQRSDIACRKDEQRSAREPMWPRIRNTIEVVPEAFGAGADNCAAVVDSFPHP
jgi:hypothetical protein